MGRKRQQAVFDNSKTKGPQRLLLTILAFHANDETGLCFPSHEKLMDEANMGESTIKRVLTQLKETGELLVSNKRGRGRGNRYIVTLGLSEAEVRRMVDDYKKKSITFETLYWEKRLKSVSEPGHYNEEKSLSSEEKHPESETLKPKSVSELSQKSLRTETSMLTKRTKRKEELKGEPKQPPPISAKPNGQGSLPQANVEQLASAIADLCKIDREIASNGKLQQVRATTVKLYQKQAQVNDVKEFGNWWRSFDWRGQKGSSPTPNQICDEWERFRSAKLNGSPMSQLDDDKLAAYKALRAQEDQ